MSYSYFGFQPYVSVAQRRAQAAREVGKLKKKGRVVAPVVIEGRKIAQSFWGKAWCDNLECYSDYASRLPRGRTYVRNGSVVDLRIERGQLHALVSGSEIYTVKIDIAVAKPSRWKAICGDCAGSVGSLVELLQGKLSKNVMERVCRADDGLFPAPGEIKMSCSCPDWADMCKHVAATLYGAGARLDAAPDLLFTLRGVDHAELISIGGADLQGTRTANGHERVLADDDVAALFGIEIAPSAAPSIGNGESGAQSNRGMTAPAAKPATVRAGEMTTSAVGRETKKTVKKRARKAPRPEATIAPLQTKPAQTSRSAARGKAASKSAADAASKAREQRASQSKGLPAKTSVELRRAAAAPTGRGRAVKRSGAGARQPAKTGRNLPRS